MLETKANMVPFLDLKELNHKHETLIKEAFNRILNSGRYILGPELSSFEDCFAKYCQAQYCCGVANGLEAIELILRAYGIGPDDEVIVPSNTFIATWLAVSNVGATPVPVEPCGKTFNIQCPNIECAITDKTKAIIPVHLYGQPCDMTAIMALSEKYSLIVIEDAAQAHGAKHRGQPVGCFGHAAAFSFYPGKNLGALGDGGAIVTNDVAIWEVLKMLRNYGSEAKYRNDLLGRNSRLDEIQAATLEIKLKTLPSDNTRRREIAAKYTEELRGLDLQLPYVPNQMNPVWHLYVIRSKNRDLLKNKLEAFGVQTLIHYPIPPHLQKAYRYLEYKKGDFPLSETIHQEVLSLPLYPSMSDAQVSHTVNAVKLAVGQLP